LNIADEQIIATNQGKLINKRGTIKLLVFKIKGKEIEIIKTDFYPLVPNNLNYILMLENFLSKVNPTVLNPIDKIIQFYKTVIELEQQKEPEISALFQYPIKDRKNDVISLDLQMNKDFYQEFKRNADAGITKWPKDLFVGLKATLNEKSYLLLSYIIPYDEIRDIDISTQQIPCRLSDFSLYLKSFEELELSDVQISEIEDSIKLEKSIEGITIVLKDKIEGINLDVNALYVALSSKNPALSQIYSELNRLNSNKVNKGSLLESFLLNQEIDNQINTLKEEDLIQISDIDDSQKKAVLNAFNNKLSVITGPPGSGKTQVILNILANAVVQNKKVLVASKNNKAVDNVKDRFDRVDEFGFFLRFGSKKVLSEITIPAIDSVINRKLQLKDNTQELDDLKNQITIQKQIIKENKVLLAKRNDLLSKFPSIELKIQAFEKQINNLSVNNSEIDFFIKLFNINTLDTYNASLKKERNNIQSKYTGIGKILFNLFRKQKYAQVIINTVEQYPFEIRNYLQTQNLKSQLVEFRKGDDIIQLYSQLITLFTKAIAYIQNYLQFENDLNNLKSELAVIKIAIDEITTNESTILSEIEKSKQEIGKLGKPLLVELIKNKIKNSPTPIINNYKDYLPDNIPFRNNEIVHFIDSTKSFIDFFNITSVTSLSAKAAFPFENELFDMVIIDEASQCDIASAIPLILRAKQLVVIGDPLQLKHISKVNDYEETFIKEHLLVSNCAFLHYNNKSLWDYSRDLLALTTVPNNVPLMIDRHYRCHPHIIGYSNEAFYTRMLHSQLTVCTTDAQFQLQPKGIVWIDIQGQQRASNLNINDAEVLKSIEIAIKLATAHKNISIGIVTPFRNQAEQLNANIPNQYRDRIIADTVYKFQGDEKDVVIYSLVVTNNSPSSKIRWIDESVPNLVNVAVTRARNTLYVVGNKEYVRQNSSTTKPLGKLVQYVERMK
jgi:superfamily I DNA and/or RNA helicase